MILLNAIVLVDTPLGVHYATLVEQQKKKIETRTRNIFKPGDYVICCGNRSMTRNKGRALCLVTLSEGRKMKEEDAPLACVDFDPNLWVFDISRWQYFNRKFFFSPCKESGSFQSIFKIALPDDVRIIKNESLS